VALQAKLQRSSAFFVNDSIDKAYVTGILAGIDIQVCCGGCSRGISGEGFSLQNKLLWEGYRYFV